MDTTDSSSLEINKSKEKKIQLFCLKIQFTVKL